MTDWHLYDGVGNIIQLTTEKLFANNELNTQKSTGTSSTSSTISYNQNEKYDILPSSSFPRTNECPLPKRTTAPSSKNNANEELLFKLKATKVPPKMIRCGHPKGHLLTAIRVKGKRQSSAVPKKYSLRLDCEKKKLSLNETIDLTWPADPKLIKSEMFENEVTISLVQEDFSAPGCFALLLFS